MSEGRSDEPDAAGLGIHSPQEIALQAGGISVKSLTEVIRKNGLETTTLGYTEPSRRGGPPRRIWGMTDEQVEALVAFRKRQESRRAKR